MKILNFGSCNIDYVYSLDHIVQKGETENTERLEIFPGGKGLNQSIAVAKAEVPIYHAGCVGYDGEILTDILKTNGVDISYIKSVDEKNGHAVIQVSVVGENSIFLYPGSNEMVSKSYIDEVLAEFSAGDMLLLQNEISNVEYIIEAAYKKGMCIIFNPSPFNKEIEKIDLHKISYLVLNEVEAKGFSGSDKAKSCLDFFEKNYPQLRVMLTLGKRGSIYFEKGEKYYQSSFNVETVDTTAAGDTFTGYFVAGIFKCEKISKVLEIASAAAAISVSRKGAAPSIPAYSEVLKELKHLKFNKKDIKSEILLREIEDYIEQNIKNATLAELSKHLGYTRSYTGTLIKRTTGITFSEVQQKKRCSIAAQLLRDTDLSVKEIIDSVGYHNESFFRKKFKKYYGANLLDFRKSEVE